MALRGGPDWWRRAVFYQIYPRSFQDSNGDGIGDIPGIASRLGYLSELGVDALWLCPVYPSPNVDGGYDVSDYRGVMPEFGTMGDMERLLAEAHALGIRVVMDLVLNHSSDRHPWFSESRSSKSSPRRGWYFWREGRDGGPPNRWASRFGGSAWTLDGATGEWYLHLFSPGQPDLDWSNPGLREEIYATMEWWLDKGVDGFRLDVINMIAKEAGLPDVPPRPGEAWADASSRYVNRPEAHAYLREMRARVLGPRRALAIGETPETGPEGAAAYVDPRRGELDMVFAFDRAGLGRGGSKWEPVPWRIKDLKAVDRAWYEGLRDGGWNSVFLGSHDEPRCVSRFGDDGAFRVPSAKLLAAYALTLPGTPFIYQGDEIGMTNGRFAGIEDCRDFESIAWYRSGIERGESPVRLMAAIRRSGRDNARTPMQWDGGPGAGFSTSGPWIGINPNRVEVNVARAKRDPDSVWRFYRRLIALRKEERLLTEGGFDTLEDECESVYSYVRAGGASAILVILNFSGAAARWRPPASLDGVPARLLASSASEAGDGRLGRSDLGPWEARVYRVGSS